MTVGYGYGDPRQPLIRYTGSDCRTVRCVVPFSVTGVWVCRSLHAPCSMHASALCLPSLQCLPVACPVGAVTMLTACRCHYMASSSAFNDMKRCCVTAPQTLINILISHRTVNNNSLSIPVYAICLGELPAVVSAQKFLRCQTNNMGSPIQDLEALQHPTSCVVNHSSVSLGLTRYQHAHRGASRNRMRKTLMSSCFLCLTFLARDILSHIVCIYYLV